MNTQTPNQNQTAAAPADPATSITRRSGRRTALIGGGIAAAALGLIAATAGITAAIAEDRDDDRDGVSDNSEGSGSTGSSSAESAPATATVAEFEDARDAALAAAGGGTLLELDREASGWSAEVLLASRDSIDVQLDEQLDPTYVEAPDAADDADRDDAPAGALAGSGIGDAVDAAVAESGSGSATQVEVKDDGDSAVYSVTVVRDDGSRLDVDLDAGFAVLRSALDD